MPICLTKNLPIATAHRYNFMKMSIILFVTRYIVASWVTTVPPHRMQHSLCLTVERNTTRPQTPEEMRRNEEIFLSTGCMYSSRDGLGKQSN